MSGDQNRGHKNQASQMDVGSACAAVPDAFSSVYQSAVLCQLVAHSLLDRYCSADNLQQFLGK
ncbi:MAG: hypothetical protein DSM106950_43240 [Stigonema ocellatum SAG 48.90 = DSM 106950]|nr:hypothetical protein [Stigonema ocellatum SAG 48.90 = DSM 106950]